MTTGFVELSGEACGIAIDILTFKDPASIYPYLILRFDFTGVFGDTYVQSKLLNLTMDETWYTLGITMDSNFT